jgi:glycylpeptide N-tetradecanoyltransferase
MRKEYLVGAYELLTDYLNKFHIAPIFSLAEFEHLMMPKNDVIYSYVIEVCHLICNGIRYRIIRSYLEWGKGHGSH